MQNFLSEYKKKACDDMDLNDVIQIFMKSYNCTHLSLITRLLTGMTSLH